YYGFYLFFLDQDNLIDKFIRKYRIHKMHKNYFFKLEQEILPDIYMLFYFVGSWDCGPCFSFHSIMFSLNINSPCTVISKIRNYRTVFSTSLLSLFQ
ncbi:MAG: hypothetical protein Q8881_02625, partial [Sweet potato little leaf phytoplasma]|nr:hypothetical protein [Sweet potato little leaf phytoplasma]